MKNNCWLLLFLLVPLLCTGCSAEVHHFHHHDDQNHFHHYDEQKIDLRRPRRAGDEK